MVSHATHRTTGLPTIRYTWKPDSSAEVRAKCIFRLASFSREVQPLAMPPNGLVRNGDYQRIRQMRI
jgi:hypothetical protein